MARGEFLIFLEKLRGFRSSKKPNWILLCNSFRRHLENEFPNNWRVMSRQLIGFNRQYFYRARGIYFSKNQSSSCSKKGAKFKYFQKNSISGPRDAQLPNQRHDGLLVRDPILRLIGRALRIFMHERPLLDNGCNAGKCFMNYGWDSKANFLKSENKWKLTI